MGLQRLRIFISSPGDVAEERVLANNLVRRLGDEFADRLWIEPVFWEHEPLLATDTFQKQIPPPHDCEVAVCILWSRLGTRLPASIHRPDGSTYASGTEFEFEDAAEGFRRDGRPQLMVYRKQAEPLVSLKDTKAVLERVRQKESLDAFIQKWFVSETDGTHKAAYHSFNTTADFETLLEEHLRKLIARRLPEKEHAATPAKLAWTSGSPFRGLDVFDFQHAPIFFGRTRAIGDVLNALRTNAAADRGFLLLVGVSGGGKSSLVRAGVLPLLTQPGVVEGVGLWRRAILKPSDAAGQLFRSLALALLESDALPELGSDGTTPDRLAAMLQQAPAGAFALIKGGLSQGAASMARERSLAQQPEARLVIVVDQLEELFTMASVTQEDRQAFIAALSALARSGRVWVIATMRGDFYHRAFELPELVALQEGSGQYLLPLPSPAELAQMIRQPALSAGLRFEEDRQTKIPLDEVLRDAATASPENLPLLEFALEELYHRRSPDGVLTCAAYRELGGVEGALTQRAEAVFVSLPPDVQATFEHVMRGLVSVGEGVGAVARQQATIASVAPTPQARSFIEAFVQARLFSADRSGEGQAMVRVTHEALLRAWPRVQQWLAADRELLIVRARVSLAARRWEAEGQRGDLLLPGGKPLEEARSLVERWADDLSQTERAFIGRSSARHDRLRRLQRIAIAALILLSVAATGAAGYAHYQRGLARAQQQHAAANLQFALKATDGLAVSVAQEIQSNTQIPTNNKLFFMNRLDTNLGELVGQVGRSDAVAALYSKFLIYHAMTLFRGGDYSLGQQTAERAEQLAGEPGRPVNGSLRPIDRARTLLALALGHLYGMQTSRADADLESCEAQLKVAAREPDPGEQIPILAARVLATRAELRFYQCRFNDAASVEVAARETLARTLKTQDAGASHDGARREALLTLGDLVVLRLDLSRVAGREKASVVRDDWKDTMAGQRWLGVGDADSLVRLMEAYGDILQAAASAEAGQANRAVLEQGQAIDRLYELTRDDPQSIKDKYLLGRALLLRTEYALRVQDLRQAELDIDASNALALAIKRQADNPLLPLRLNVLGDLYVPDLTLAQGDSNAAVAAAVRANARLDRFRRAAADMGWLDRLAAAVQFSAASAYLAAGKEHLAKRSAQASSESVARIAQRVGWNSVLHHDDLAASYLLLSLGGSEVGSDEWAAVFERAIQDVNLELNTAPDKSSWLGKKGALLELKASRLAQAGSYDQADVWYRQTFEALFAAQACSPGDLDAAAAIVGCAARRLSGQTARAQWDEAIATARLARRAIPAAADAPSGGGNLLATWSSLQSAMDRQSGPTTGPATTERAAASDAFVQERQTVRSLRSQVETLCAAAAHRASAERSADLGRLIPASVKPDQFAGGWTGDAATLRRQLDWNTEPTYLASWRTLIGGEFDRAAALFTQIAALRGAAGPSAIRRIREAALPFYDGGRLLEAEFVLPSGDLYTAPLLAIRDKVYDLNGTSPPIHQANAEAPLKLSDAASAAAYLRFFCGYLASGFSGADQNAFTIIDRVDLLPWEPHAAEDQRIAVSRALRPVVVWPDATRPGAWRATATVQVGNAVYHSSFELAKDGMVEMLNDQKALGDLSLQPPRFTEHGRFSRSLRSIDLRGLGELPVADEVHGLLELSESLAQARPNHAADLAAEAADLEIALDDAGISAGGFVRANKVLTHAVNQHMSVGRFEDAFREQDALVQRWIRELAGVDPEHPRYRPSMIELSGERSRLASLALRTGHAQRAKEILEANASTSPPTAPTSNPSAADYPSFSKEFDPGKFFGPPAPGLLFTSADFLLGKDKTVIIVVPATLPAQDVFVYVDWYRIAFTTQDKLLGDLTYQGGEVHDRLIGSDQVGIVEYPPGHAFPKVITNVAKVRRGRPPTPH